MNGQMVCEVCGIFVEVSKYEMHKKFGHKKKANEENKCNICDKTFPSKLVNLLKYHYWIFIEFFLRTLQATESYSSSYKC